MKSNKMATLFAVSSEINQKHFFWPEVRVPRDINILMKIGYLFFKKKCNSFQ